MKIKVVLTNLIILSCIQVHSQAIVDFGYIVRLNGDTLTGFISNASSNYTAITFKERWSDRSQVFTTSDIHSYGVKGSSLYRSNNRIESGDNLKIGFYEVLLESKISLYYLGEYYLRLEDGRFVKIEKRSFTKNMSSILLGNCLYKFAQRASRLTWSKSELVLFFRDYNDCLNSKTVIHYVEKLKVNVGAGIGYSLLTSSGNDSSRPDLGSTATSESYEYFLFANSTIPGMNNRFRIHVLGSYSPVHSFLIDFQEGNTYYETQFKLTYIQIEPSLRYHLNLANKFYVSPGIGLGIGLVQSNYQSRIIERVEGNTVLTSDGSNELEISKSIFAMNGILAIGYQLSPKKYLFVESKVGIGGKLLVIDENKTNIVSGRVGMGFSIK